MIGSADLTQAIVRLWDDSDLDLVFNTFWEVDDRTRFLVLNDQEARPKTPFPYCIFEAISTPVENRSAGGQMDERNRDYRSTTLLFNIQAKQQGTTTAKQQAVQLAEQVMRYYGGHPDYSPGSLSLSHGGVLLCSYQNDYGVKTSDEEYSWIVEYKILTDVPGQG